MTFGVRAADAPDRGSDGMYLRPFAQGDNLVRFCEEPDDWTAFWEHYNSDNKSYPCTGDRKTCPGCNSEDVNERKGNFKYATTVKLVDKDVYVPMRVPSTVYKKMRTRATRNDNTILTRDYVVIRSGKGWDTEYDVEADRAYTIPAKELRENTFVIEDVLQAMWDEVWGSDAGAPDDTQDETITEEELRAMTTRELRPIARKAGVDGDIAELGSKMELIDAILKAAS